jgi:endonuclease YncB( thermonuclease family)
LVGIDAPELKQQCYRDSQPIKCGERVKNALIEKIGDHSVQCKITGRDRYQRYLAQCYVEAVELNSWLVSNGYALAYRTYSHDYVLQEEQAKQKRRFLHNLQHTPPWKWRQKNR